MLALYIFTLALSSGIFGLFCRDVFAEIGYLPGFTGGIAIAVAAALLYACIQALYVALLRLVKPTKDPAYLFMEVLSHLSALLLVPHILGFPAAWPHPILAKAAPAIYFGLFLIVHALLKLAGFYACLRARPTYRWGAFGWMAMGGVLFLAAWAAFSAWLGAMDAVRNQSPETYASVGVDGIVANAAPLVEGGEVVWSIAPDAGESVFLQLAPQGDVPHAYVTLTAAGAGRNEVTRLISLADGGWTTVKLTPEELPARTNELRLSWRLARDPIWERILNLPPVIRRENALFVSPPAVYGPTGPETGPNMVVALIDGLGYGHMSSSGYPRETTPSLDAVARSNVHFTQAFSLAPSAELTLASLLMGEHPLMYASAHQRTVSLAAALAEKGYATAAFIETGNADDGLLQVCEGFGLIDTAYDPEAGSAATLRRAQAWIREHESVRHFVVVRLRELAGPLDAERYGQGFVREGVEPAQRDVYDAALAHLDEELGRWLHELESGPGGQRLCYAVTASGLDFYHEDGAPAPELPENALHVPLILRLPSRLRAQRDELCSTGQLGCALRVLGRIEGASGGALDAFGAESVVSASASQPIVLLSLRDTTWRFTYDTGAALETGRQWGTRGPISLHYVGPSPDVDRRRNMSEHPAVVERLTEDLEQWFERAKAGSLPDLCATP